MVSGENQRGFDSLLVQEFMFKAYIGDGVYVDTDGYQIILTTENGVSVTNRIVLEPEVWKTLLEWVNKGEIIYVLCDGNMEAMPRRQKSTATREEPVRARPRHQLMITAMIAENVQQWTPEQLNCLLWTVMFIVAMFVLTIAIWIGD